MDLEKAQEAQSREVYDLLRDGLIWGRWKSGERLKPQHLKTEFHCTTTALREALLRLAGEGLVVSEKNFGFRAVVHSEETFREAAHLRLILEREAATIALQTGDLEWEMALSAAHNKLNYVETLMDRSDDITPYVAQWSKQDWEFHYTLLAGCGSTLLMKNYKTTFDTFRMYAVSETKDYGFAGQMTINEHNDIFETAIRRDVPACIQAIERHLTLFKDGNRSAEPVPAKKQIALKADQLSGS